MWRTIKNIFLINLGRVSFYIGHVIYDIYFSSIFYIKVLNSTILLLSMTDRLKKKDRSASLSCAKEVESDTKDKKWETSVGYHFLLIQKSFATIIILKIRDLFVHILF